ncbi:hypothetical protein [Parabacteroides chinchillae]|uniref:Uncharacterized protein n=1 Tax=Parabacteroides chinchillae TaxID=871327 RepID=A0A8G2BUR7_9BACT|nr:hypothetical protein [Parabacteroides chinchillae]SEF60568.1 hypothetical protein SAMN05444001_103103 [Parabacteroides chinchillae]
MKTEQNNLEQLKGKNPFSVPQGYMEGITSQIMNQLPDKPDTREKQVSMFDRIRPWLYMAAVFAGLGLFFKAIVGIQQKEENVSNPLIVKTAVPSESLVAIQAEEDQEYLEYLEERYTDYLFDQEMADSEIN